MNWPVLIAGLSYIWAAVNAYNDGHLNFTGMYICYFLANIFIMMGEASK